MAPIGQTVFRFGGALLLAATATAIDHPELLFAPKREAVASRGLVPDGPGSGFGVMITPGKRAYAIRIDDVGILARLIHPNSRVDIMVVIDDPEQRGKRVAKLFMENMKVLAIGAAPDQPGRSFVEGVASIEVTPEEAERLAIASALGRLQLLLRGNRDADSLANLVDQLRGRRDQCGAPPGGSIVRDLLNRVCSPVELKFQKESDRVDVVPGPVVSRDSGNPRR